MPSTRLSYAVPAPSEYRIGVHGRLDAVTGARLLRLLDSRLNLAHAGLPPTRSLLIDLTAVDGVETGGLRALERAQRAAELHEVGVAVLVDAAFRARVPFRDRHLLRALRAVSRTDDDRTPVPHRRVEPGHDRRLLARPAAPAAAAIER